MLTKTVLDKLAEELAETLDPEEITELSRICGGAYGPGAFAGSQKNHEPIIACVALYAEECKAGFSEQQCYDEARFDWPGCRQPYSGAVPSPWPPPGPPGAVIDDECSDFTCVAKFTCSKDEEDGPFNCDYGSQFACEDIYICFGEFTCEVSHECAQQYGCTGGYTCTNQHSCPDSHTCGEGVGSEIGDQFSCLVVFDCGHNEENPGGNFTCREKHDCTHSFTCHFDDNCGEIGVQGTMFTCGTDMTMPPSGNFDCVHEHMCREKFACINVHTCGDGVLEDVFKCGASPGKFECLNSFHCKDDFQCGDSAEDRFACGNGEPGDTFACGDDDKRVDKFDCFAPGTNAVGFHCDPGPNEHFTCVDEYGCNDNQDYKCVGGYACAQFVCNDAANSTYTCVDSFMCGTDADGNFECGSGLSASNFECGDRDRNLDEYGCWSPASFDCHGDYDCAEVYTCDGNRAYECTGAPAFICISYDCNAGDVAVFRCADGPDQFECTGQFACPKTFACFETHACPSEFNCGSASSFRCDVRHVCIAGFGCTKYLCNDDPEVIPQFECMGPSGEFDCLPANHECRRVFRCVWDRFECPSSPYSCDAEVFDCSGKPGPGGYTGDQFRCSTQGTAAQFDCVDGSVFDYLCSSTGLGDYECTAGSFTCTAQHVFFCGGEDQLGGVFECPTFVCRPGGNCTPQTSYDCTSEHPYGCRQPNPAFEKPGDFGCWSTFTGCVEHEGFECEEQLSGHDFYCRTFGGRKSVENPEESSERRKGQASATEVAPLNEDRRSSSVPGVLGARCKRVTWPQLADLLSRRSQIALEEARSLLGHVLRTYFNVELSNIDVSSDLRQLLDFRKLALKLGFTGVI